MFGRGEPVDLQIRALEADIVRVRFDQVAPGSLPPGDRGARAGDQQLAGRDRRAGPDAAAGRLMYNEPSGQTTEELTERAVAALVREWGITEVEARAAIDRARDRERKFGPEMAAERVRELWLDDAPSRIIDLTDPAHVA